MLVPDGSMKGVISALADGVPGCRSRAVGSAVDSHDSNFVDEINIVPLDGIRTINYAVIGLSGLGACLAGNCNVPPLSLNTRKGSQHHSGVRRNFNQGSVFVCVFVKGGVEGASFGGNYSSARLHSDLVAGLAHLE